MCAYNLNVGIKKKMWLGGERVTNFSTLMRFCSGVVICLGLFLVDPMAHGQVLSEEGVGPFRTQTIELEAGWNAVYLEIEPLDSDPGALFHGTPIEIAAAYFRPVTPMEFIDSPNEILPDRKSWSVWYAPERDDAILSNLYTIQSHRGYLLYSEEAFTWTLSGSPFYGSALWHPNAYSLVGFPIDANAPPTLANFFSGSTAHTPLKIYRLDGGHWVLVTNPEEVLMESGVAYWTYSEGASQFRGPLQVDFVNRSAGGLIFFESSGVRQLEITNVASYPQHLTLTFQPGTTGLLPMAYVLRVLNGPNQPIEQISVPFPQTLRLGPIEPGQAFSLDLEVVQDEVTVPVQSATLSIVSDAGQHAEVPLVSIRRDLGNP